MNTDFILFSNCILVKGANRSVICDLQREEAELIPNDLVDIISALENKSIDETVSEFGIENRGIIIEYLDYLESKEYGFYCHHNEKVLFPKMDITFETPNEITNAIIEVDKLDYVIIESLFKQLDKLLCDSVHLFFYSKISKDDLLFISKLSRDNSFRSIEITAPFNENNLNQKQLLEIDKKPNKIVQMVFYSSPKEEILAYGDPFLFKVVYTKKDNLSSKSCGVVSSDYFYVNQKKVLESLNCNSCLYKKIAVDVKGAIKNCPSMSKSFGNIEDVSLQKAIEKPDFKKYWNLTKDQINICRDCEFRHICTDCRAYREDPNDIYSKPLKCGYDPYTNEWSEWSKNPLKEKAIAFYGLNEH